LNNDIASFTYILDQITFYYQPTTMGCAYRRNKPKGVKRPNPKDELPWGYDTPLVSNTLLKDTVPIDDFVKIVTKPSVDPSFPGALKNVLIYWDRGNENTGDEAKTIEMEIDS
jgi:hypothetical protein